MDCFIDEVMKKPYSNITSSTELTVSTDAHTMIVSTSQTVSSSSGQAFTTPPVKKQRLSEVDTAPTSH